MPDPLRRGGKDGDAHFLGGSMLITELKTAWHQQDVLLFPSHRVTHASAISLVATVGELRAGTLPPQKAPPPCLTQHPPSGQACQTHDHGQTTHQNVPPPRARQAAVGDRGSLKQGWKARAEPKVPGPRAPGDICSRGPARHWTCFLLCNYVNEPVRASCTAGQGRVSNAATSAASQGDLLKQPTGSDLGGQPQGRGPSQGTSFRGNCLLVQTGSVLAGTAWGSREPRAPGDGLSWRVIPT